MRESWLSANDARVIIERSEYEAWWQVFQDPVLANLIDQAYRQNLSLQIAGLRILDARAQYGISVALQYPQSQSVGGGYVRNRSSENQAPFSSLPADISNGIDHSTNLWNLSFDTAWEADIWGRTRRGIEAATATVAATMLDYDSALVTLTGDVAALYTTVRTFEVRLDYARNNVELQREALELAEARFELGAASELDVEQSRSLLLTTRALIPSLKLGLGTTKNALSLLLGLPPSDLQAQLGSSGAIPSVPVEVAVGIPADLIRRRPDVRAAEMAAAAQSAAIGVSQAELYPHFALAGSFGLAGDSFSDQFDSGSGTGYFTPFFSWNVFNFDRIKNNVRVQDARFEQLVVAYQNSVLSAAREVEDGLLGFLYAQEQVGHLDGAVTASERAAELALIQYGQGAVDYTRVLDTQTTLLLQQDALTLAQGRRVTSLVAIYKALGGGWQIRDDNDYVKADTKAKMGQRTDWGGLLEMPGPPGPPSEGLTF